LLPRAADASRAPGRTATSMPSFSATTGGTEAAATAAGSVGPGQARLARYHEPVPLACGRKQPT
jgi:hypothetical protein